MGRRRGFFAELQHQAKVAAREQARLEREAERQQRAYERETAKAQREQERLEKQMARAAEAERKQLAKEAKEAHLAEMEAETERRNAELADRYEEIDSLLAATLDVDDYVDLETLRRTTSHPPFLRTDLEQPIPPPPQPVYSEPAPPTGLLGKLFGKGKHQREVASAKAAHEKATADWQEALKQHERAEADRTTQLEKERARYKKECEWVPIPYSLMGT